MKPELGPSVEAFLWKEMSTGCPRIPSLCEVEPQIALSHLLTVNEFPWSSSTSCNSRSALMTMGPTKLAQTCSKAPGAFLVPPALQGPTWHPEPDLPCLQRRGGMHLGNQGELVELDCSPITLPSGHFLGSTPNPSTQCSLEITLHSHSPIHSLNTRMGTPIHCSWTRPPPRPESSLSPEIEWCHLRCKTDTEVRA